MKRIKSLLIPFLMCLTGGTAILIQLSFRKMYPVHKGADKPGGSYMLSLNSFDDFKAMQGAPLSDKYNDVLSVKIVYDLQARVLYFVHSSAYRYHYDFCRLVLGDNDPLEIFNPNNYGNTVQRQYFLANLNYYEHSHIYALEFSSEDQISPAGIVQLYKMVKEKTYLHDSLKLLVGTDNFVKLDNEGKLGVPKVYASEIYNGQKFQMLNAGITYGILRKAEDLEEGSNFPQDIVIIKGTPVNVPICAGIITNSYQTPLSHINILCHNRDIPSAVQTDIWDYPEVKKNLGKPVRMEVTQLGITITPADQKTVDSFKNLHTIVAPVLLKYDLTVKDLLPIKSFGLKQKDIIGNKAAGVGELNKIAHKLNSNFYVPESGFAIPFYYYSEHIANAPIRWKINDLEKMQAAHASEKAIREQLQLIRKAIKDQPLDPQLLTAVLAMIKTCGDYKSFRFRSSANAEDVLGFSAAGLYDSKTGKVNDADKPIDMAIKKVWASAYNDNAYFERVASGIDEHTMMMGILVHRNFPDEAVNGVAVTRNLYRDNFPGFTINVQVGEVPVVSPPDSVTCEQFVCMRASAVNPLNDAITADYITYSNLNNNKPILTPKQVDILYNALANVKSYYTYNIPQKEAEKYKNGLDIEFKFEKNGRLYLKQARPYR